MSLVELAFTGDFLLPLCSHKDNPPLMQALQIPTTALSLHLPPPSLTTTDASCIEVRKLKYQEAFIRVCCPFLPLTSWLLSTADAGREKPCIVPEHHCGMDGPSPLSFCPRSSLAWLLWINRRAWISTSVALQEGHFGQSTEKIQNTEKL